MRKLVGSLMLVLLVGCATQEVAQVPAPPVVESKPVASCYGKWCYDEYVEATLTEKLLKADPGFYCPKYTSVNKPKF